MSIRQYEKKVNSNKNRNTRFVKIRAQHNCIMSTIYDLERIPFDDEGGALANIEALSEYEEKWLDCGKCNFAEILNSK